MGLIRASDGAIAATYDYTPFGTTTANETYVQNRFRFASGEFVDAGSAGGLYYFRNRYYDPDLRRWISEDPLGLEGGPNWYAYVGNNPINLADPWGLKAEGDCTRWEYYYYQQGDRIVLGAACASRRRSGASETAGSRAVGPGNGGPDEPGRGGGGRGGGSRQATPSSSAGQPATCGRAQGHLVATATLDLAYAGALVAGAVQITVGPVLIVAGVATANPALTVAGVYSLRFIPSGLRTFRAAATARMALGPSYALAKAAEGYGHGWGYEYMAPGFATGDAIQTVNQLCQ